MASDMDRGKLIKIVIIVAAFLGAGVLLMANFGVFGGGGKPPVTVVDDPDLSEQDRKDEQKAIQDRAKIDKKRAPSGA